MSLVQTNLIPVGRFLPFVGSGPQQQYGSPIPRAEVTFSAQSTAVAASAAGDSQMLRITCTLPPSFAYVLQEVNLFELVGDDVGNWENCSSSRISNSAPTDTWVYALNVCSSGKFEVAGFGVTKSWFLEPGGGLRKVIIPGTACDLVVHIGNDTLEQSSVSLGSFFARFLVFDIQQAHNYVMNTPQIVR